MTDSELDSLY